MALIDDVKFSLRIRNTVYNTEIQDLIEACKSDLGLAGVNFVEELDPLIQRAIILYVKANFGNSPDSEKYQEKYDMLKCSLALAGDYNTVQ